MRAAERVRGPGVVVPRRESVWGYERTGRPEEVEALRGIAQRWRFMVLLAAMLLVAAACRGDGGGAAGDGERGTFKVGLLNPTTGIFAALGGDTNEGFQMYLEEKGGVFAGWTIETVIKDDEGDPTAGATKARELIERDQVDFLIGGVSSAVAYGIADFVATSGVPYIITIAGADGLTQADHQPNIFRISYTGSQPMHPLGEYVCNELGLETATVVSLDFAFGWETAGGFSRTYEEAGCDVTQEIYVPLETEDYAPFVQQISRNTDVVMHVNSGPAGNLFWQTYRDFGFDQPVVGHGAITDEFLLDTEEDWHVKAQTIFYWSRALDSPGNVEFVEAYEERTGRLVSQGAEAGYAAAQVLEAALEAAGDDATDPAALQEALKGVTVEAPRGELRFDDFNQAVMDFYIREVQEVEEDPLGNAEVNKANVVIETIPDVSQFWTFDPDEYLELPTYDGLKGTWTE
jgi:branched-chain amino acid transport system substrate-binding protein